MMARLIAFRHSAHIQCGKRIELWQGFDENLAKKEAASLGQTRWHSLFPRPLPLAGS
jgi:hypothetical protein